MKFPFGFSLSLGFRLFFPGMVLAVAFWPIVHRLLNILSINSDPKVALPIAAVVFGWLIVLSDQPIYQIYEGRMGWPHKLWKWAQKREAKRLAHAISEGSRLYKANKPQQAAEFDVITLDFPFDTNTGEPVAKYPTRLGNIVTAFEAYSDFFWGADAIFYWPRLWVMLDKDLKSALDEQQAICDGALYVSFALVLTSLIFVCYALGGSTAALFGPLFRLPDLPSPGLTLALAAASMVLAYGLYRLSLHQQRVYGDLFRSIFDQHMKDLAFADDAAAKAKDAGADPAAVSTKKYRVAELWLRYNRIFPSGQTEGCTPQEWAKRKPAGQKSSPPQPTLET